MTNETIDYVNNWEKELEKINGNELTDFFNRFQTLYPIYNRLYNDAFRIEQAKNKELNRISDYEKATVFVRDFIGSDLIIDNLKADNRIEDIKAISDLIDNKVFHINLRDGIGQEKFDKQLSKNLMNEQDNSIRAKAVLSVIYNVRCNLVHGYKNLEEHQRMLLEPVQNLLRTIFDTLKHRLK
jgi:Mg2+ and Co2+ transporter CorA